MKTPEQLKGAIRNIAKAKNLRSQEVLQMFLFERILDRLAASPYRNNFILKGGLLISSMIGISERTTMDMDTTVRGIDMTEDEISRIVQEIFSVILNDGIQFTFKRIEPIREDDDYNNFRVYFEAEYGKIKNPMKMDITTGDEITPAAIQYEYPLLFEERSIPVMAYTLETILAEKYETVMRRNIGTTRARDFYDLYALYYTHKEQIRIPVLKVAVEHTARKRGSLDLLAEWEEILADIREEDTLKNLWRNYVTDNPYAADLTFEDVADVVSMIGRMLTDEAFKKYG
ncbi:MAG: nucleotidyl transferase AbiEii/AbiGii toxin family protein [Lachnospiraceae bacterium]|nr:nucleotidyl transferase AbiEii/AbiGii toxin family protein [Lachnospiraceae bacterium]